jgi:hypothetical protein
MLSVDNYDASVVLFNKLLGRLTPKMKAIGFFESTVTNSQQCVTFRKTNLQGHSWESFKNRKQIVPAFMQLAGSVPF